jgi:hypothetical protein
LLKLALVMIELLRGEWRVGGEKCRLQRRRKWRLRPARPSVASPRNGHEFGSLEGCRRCSGSGCGGGPYATASNVLKATSLVSHRPQLVVDGRDPRSGRRQPRRWLPFRSFRRPNRASPPPELAVVGAVRAPPAPQTVFRESRPGARSGRLGGVHHVVKRPHGCVK